MSLIHKQAFLLFLCALNAWTQGIITTIAGTDFIFPSSLSSAVSAPLGAVAGVTVDDNGNLYVSDSSNSMVFKVAANGVMTIVAGTGRAGFSGDGALAVNAALNGPEGIALDAFGNVLIADKNNNRIRRVNPAGMITTVAGDGRALFAGDGRSATAASLTAPRAVAADSAGNLYIADWGNLRIRKVSPDGIISTVAGNGQNVPATGKEDGSLATESSLYSPANVALDSFGNLFIAGDWPIRKVTPAGVISSIFEPFPLIAVGPPGLLCSGITSGVASDAAGNLYVTDVCSRVVLIPSSGSTRILAGSSLFGFNGDGGLAVAASLWKPQGVVVDAQGNVFVADTGNGRIRRINTAGLITTAAGNGGFRFGGDGGDARVAYLSYPRGVAVSATGELFIADTENNRIREVSQGTIATIAGTGAFFFSGDGGLATAATLAAPYGVAKDSLGNLFIADTVNSRVRKVDSTGSINTILGGANGVALSSQNNLFVTDFKFVYELTASGVASVFAGNVHAINGFSGDGGPATSAQFNGGMGVATDAFGNVFVADFGNHRIREVLQDGTIRTMAGNGLPAFSGDGGPPAEASLRNPTGVAVDGSGNVFIADSGNHRIRMVTADGTISTVAGTGQPALSGDGGLSAKAALNAPQGVAVDVDGNLYIADSGNHRIRKVAGAGAPLLPGVNEIVSAATFKSGAVAPGSLISIYGANLASAISQASQWPLPRSLGGAQVLLGDETLPVLYASPGQLNVQVPFDLPARGSFQFKVIRDGSASLPAQVDSTPAQPGIFTFGHDGTGQGAITRSDGVTLARPGTPAMIGETVVIYCTGLGSVSPPVDSGSAAPLSPLSVADAKVTAQIGGQPALVTFAGLSPGFSGLYQVNVVVPRDIQTGDSVTVMLSVAGQNSPEVTMAVR